MHPPSFVRLSAFHYGSIEWKDYVVTYVPFSPSSFSSQKDNGLFTSNLPWSIIVFLPFFLPPFREFFDNSPNTLKF